MGDCPNKFWLEGDYTGRVRRGYTGPQTYSPLSTYLLDDSTSIGPPSAPSLPFWAAWAGLAQRGVPEYELSLVFYDMSLLGYDEHSLGKKQYISWQNHHIILPADTLYPLPRPVSNRRVEKNKEKKGCRGEISSVC